MKTLKQLMSAAVLSILASTAVAQTEQTTDNLVYTTVNPAPTGAMPHSWTGFNSVTSTGGNTTGDNGAVTGYNPNTGTFMFGYNQGTIAYTYAINQALSGTGIQVRGYNWSWEINNNNYDNRQGSVDTLTARILTYAPNNVDLRRVDSWTYDTKFDWTTFSGTVNYVTPGSPSEFGNMRIEFSGRDSGFWAGYYGPQVRNVNVSLNYTVDQCSVNPQSSPTCPGFKTYYQMWDDGYARVDLPFAFPFYGQLFTTSYMYTNGVVGFLNNNWGFCCDGTDLHNQVSQPNSPWNYAIYALNTDLIPGPNSEFYTQITDGGTGLKYSWVNVPEIGTDLNNTFHVQIKNSGYIGITYDQVNLNPWRNPLIGIAGDISQGQYSMTYYGQASGLPALAGTTNVYTGTEVTDYCSINPLHNTSCPGYATAYFNQQCTFNSLYDPQCPGYASAYYDYQCSINPLYHTGCTGYEQAYFNQQCAINPLYNSQCPGYADAFYIQQCTANPLYDSGCTGYAQAYFNQQCSLNGLYDRTCPNYADAYARQQLLNPPATSTPESIVVAQVEESKPALVSDPVVNEVITTTATSASPAQAATATVPLAPAPAPATTVAVAAAEKKEEKSSDTSKDTSSSSTNNSSSSSSEKKDEPKTTRQQLAERRLEAARAKAVEQGKNLANDMGNAATMEAQVAVQNVVLSAMGFVPGFDAYGKVNVPDAVGYKPFTIYNNQKNVDNARMMRGLSGASDRLHADMVNSQYK
jgi:hypothetical protein